MRKMFPVLFLFLLIAAWRYRGNRPLFFVIAGTLFATAAIPISGSQLPDPILQACGLAWAACMLAALAFGIVDLSRYVRRKRSSVATQGNRGQ